MEATNNNSPHNDRCEKADKMWEIDDVCAECLDAVLDAAAAEQEAECRAEFVNGWVVGGGSASDAHSAWAMGLR